MKSQYIEELKSGQVVKENFILSRKILREKKDGGMYAMLELSDRTGSIEAVAWDNVVESLRSVSTGDVVFVAGTVNEYNNRLQIVVQSLRRTNDADIDPKDFLPETEEDTDKVFEEIVTYRKKVKDPHLISLLDVFFKDTRLITQFKVAPAAKRAHHAYLGGLMVHTRNVLDLTEHIAQVYTSANRDLLITAGILHDIGKVYEYQYIKSIDFSTEGRMLGHVVIGYELVARLIQGIPDFPDILRCKVLHMILSHHGEFEWGAPKLPVFVEALILHFADNLDSKVAMMTETLKKYKGHDREWSDFHPFLERELYVREDDDEQTKHDEVER
ncbi:MAG: HD domain-containing protein [candidate division WOR-3 bacterium]|nr:MAG: HD domain-containing protein [candidate division WOR-3 bacterium]